MISFYTLGFFVYYVLIYICTDLNVLINVYIKCKIIKI